jgi:hypothetical protein
MKIAVLDQTIALAQRGQQRKRLQCGQPGRADQMGMPAFQQ